MRPSLLLSLLPFGLASIAACGGGDDTGSTGSTSTGGGAGASAAGSATAGTGTAGSGIAGSGTAGSTTAGKGGGVGGMTNCMGSYTHCIGGKEVSGTCNVCMQPDCNMPDGHVSCGGGTCVTGGKTCGGTAGAGGAGQSCGGIASKPCPPDTLCVYSPKTCGAGDMGGTCKPKPVSCPVLPDDLVCGCDGQVYKNVCISTSAGVDTNAQPGACKAPAGTFGCGDHFCASATSFCEIMLSDVVGDPDTYTCKALPVGCGAMPTCGCLSAVSCAGSCKEGADGGLTTTCGGG